MLDYFDFVVINCYLNKQLPSLNFSIVVSVFGSENDRKLGAQVLWQQN
jgi:hypothetical protein